MENQIPLLEHPRLYFTRESLGVLRAQRTQGVHAHIWRNIEQSAQWCLTQVPRQKWIAPIEPDPIYLNLYDRFFAMMHDMAVMEHLAFAYAYSGEGQYLEAARQWVLSCCCVWQHEAEGEADVVKAYAVTRLLKGVAVSYDLLHESLNEEDRNEIVEVLAEIGQKYYDWYLENPGMAGPDQDPHHGTVEAASFGVMALALLGEVPQARDWLDLMVRKHTEYLLPHALTPSGTQEQLSNYWASTMQYRLFFMDALRRVTGQDLFAEYAQFMDARIALAAVAGPHRGEHDEVQQSILFGPSYGQLNYWSPVLLYLAREYRRPIYQHLALWDETLGLIPKTRYVTSNGEEMLFSFGGYAYAWYDSTVPDTTEGNLPLSFEFPDGIRWEDGKKHTEVYMHTGYEAGDISVAMRLGRLIVHAAGRAVLIDMLDFHHQPHPVEDVKLHDDGIDGVMSCKGVEDSGFSEQTVTLHRPDRVTIRRQTEDGGCWWCHRQPEQRGNQLIWPGVVLTVVRGTLLAVEAQGYYDEKVVGMGKLKMDDPMPLRYPLITAQPHEGELVIVIESKAIEATASGAVSANV